MSICPHTHKQCSCQPQERVPCPYGPMPNDLSMQAYDLILLLHDSGRTPELEQHVREWIARSPEHARVFEKCTSTYDFIWSETGLGVFSSIRRERR